VLQRTRRKRKGGPPEGDTNKNAHQHLENGIEKKKTLFWKVSVLEEKKMGFRD